jgi:hypothetical protein
MVVSNHVERTDTGLEDTGIEISLSDLVKQWAHGGLNHGLCIRRLPNRADDLSSLLPQNMDAPELTIIYVPGEPSRRE